MIQLSWRFFKKGWRVQAAITCLFTASITLLIVYGTYLQREGSLLHVRMTAGIQSDLIRVEATDRQLGAGGLKAYHGPGDVPVVHLGSWRVDITETSCGELPIAYVVEDNGLDLQLTADGIVVPAIMASEYSLAVGSSMLVKSEDGSFKRYSVTQIHDGAIYGHFIIMHDSTSLESDIFLYRILEGSVDSAVSYIRRTYPRGIFESAQSSRRAAQEIIDAFYSPGEKARYEVVLFISIAFLTVTLFGFLEKRKVLAMLKAVGFKAKELVTVIAGEAAIPPVLGSLLGCLAGYLVLTWLNRTGQQFTIEPRTFAVAIMSIWPAVAAGILIPARLTAVGTVNQLLYERPIPLHTVAIMEAKQRYPSLDYLVAAGVRLLKLPLDYGEVQGFVFRSKGDYVRKGEVVAVEERWWGLQVVEYVSPITGQVVYFETETGMMGIAPEANAVI